MAELLVAFTQHAVPALGERPDAEIHDAEAHHLFERNPASWKVPIIEMDCVCLTTLIDEFQPYLTLEVMAAPTRFLGREADEFPAE